MVPGTIPAAEFPIAADDGTQELIKQWVATTSRDRLPGHFSVLAKLEPIARKDYERFSQQVMLYVYHHLDESALTAYQLFVFCSVPRTKIASALAPYLYSSDSKLRQLVREIFPFTFLCTSKGRFDYPDYSHFQLLLRHDGDSSANSLTRMMFEYSPSAAFLQFHRKLGAAERMSARRRERIVANALYEKTQLGGLPDGKIDRVTAEVIEQLGESPYWWARLFVAEIMVQHKEFRNAELVTRLLKDENELVRQSVASIEKPDPLRFGEVDR